MTILSARALHVTTMRGRGSATSSTAAEAPMGEDQLPPAAGMIQPLTGLRFLAALSVAVAHGAAMSPKVASLAGVIYWLKTGGGLGMTLFFVLSGFVIHYNYATLIATKKMSGVADFLWARFARLYPLFLLALLFDVFSGPGLLGVVNGGAPWVAVAVLPYFLVFVQSWFYLVNENHLVIYAMGRTLPLTWSVSTEWFFYLMYPLVLLMTTRLRGHWGTFYTTVVWCVIWPTALVEIWNRLPEIDAWASGAFGPIAASGDESFPRWLLYFSPYSRIGEFILGCLVAHLYRQLKSVPISKPEQGLAGAATWLVLATVPAMMYLAYSQLPPVLLPQKLNLNFALAPSMALMIFLSARYPTAFSRFLSLRLLVVLGEASYSVYLIHLLIFFALPENDTVLPDNLVSALYVGIRLLFALILICIVGCGLNRAFELPTRRWLRRLWARSQPPRRLAYAAAPGAVAWSLALLIPCIMTYSPFAVSKGISIEAATYGGNCGAVSGNVTASLARLCNGNMTCSYVIDHRVIGDPAPGCGKGFSLRYRCLPTPEERRSELIGSPSFDADGKTVRIACSGT